MIEKISVPLEAPPSTIRANLIRLFGSITAAAEKTGLSRAHIQQTILRTGTVSDTAAGRLYKLGIDPAELVKPPP